MLSPKSAMLLVGGRQQSARTANLLLVDLEGIAVGHLELHKKSHKVSRHIPKYSSSPTISFFFSLSIPRRSTYGIRRIRRVDTLPIKQEPHALRRLALPLAEGVHQLLQLGGALDLEEHLVAAVCDFDVQVFADGLLVFGLLAGGGSVVVGHVCDCVVRVEDWSWCGDVDRLVVVVEG
jgi:hypothetical protein